MRLCSFERVLYSLSEKSYVDPSEAVALYAKREKVTFNLENFVCESIFSTLERHIQKQTFVFYSSLVRISWKIIDFFRKLSIS